MTESFERLNIFGCIKTEDDITTNDTMNDDMTICDPWHNNKQWMMNDEWRMIVTRRRQAEPMERNHEHQTNPLDLWPDKIQNPWSINLFSKMTQPWLIDTPTTDETLKHNKSGSLVLVPMGGSVTTLFLLLLLLWTFVRWEETWKGENDKRDSTEEDRDRRRWMMRRQTTESNCYNFYSFTHSFSLNYTLNFIL